MADDPDGASFDRMDSTNNVERDDGSKMNHPALSADLDAVTRLTGAAGATYAFTGLTMDRLARTVCRQRLP